MTKASEEALNVASTRIVISVFVVPATLGEPLCSLECLMPKQSRYKVRFFNIDDLRRALPRNHGVLCRPLLRPYQRIWLLPADEFPRKESKYHAGKQRVLNSNLEMWYFVVL